MSEVQENMAVESAGEIVSDSSTEPAFQSWDNFERESEVDGQIVSKEDFFKHSGILQRAAQSTLGAGPDDNDEEEDAAKDDTTVEEKDEVPEAEVSDSEETKADEATESRHDDDPIDEPMKIKMPDGKEVTLDQVAEWEKGYMLQADYTRKTQALAEERRKLEQERAAFDPATTQNALQLWEDMTRDPIGTLDKLREYFEQQGIYEAKDPAILAQEDRIRQLEQEKMRLEMEQQRQMQEAAYQQLESQLANLEAKYGKDFDRVAVLKFMEEKFNENKVVYDPETAFKAMHHDIVVSNLQKQIDEMKAEMKKVKEEAVNEYLKTKTAKTKKENPPPVGAVGSSNSGPVVRINPPKTLEEAKKAALARFQPG